MKILHLIIDHQVIERMLGVYENVFPYHNDVIIFSLTTNFKHLHKYKECPVILRNQGEKEGKFFDFSDYTHIIAHYLTMDMIDFIKSAPIDVHVCWEVYGADLYNQFLEPNGFKLYYTNPVRYDKYRVFRRYLPCLFKLALEVKGYEYQFNFQINRQFKYISHRINSIQHCCYYDAALIEQYASRKIHSYEVFNYSLSEVLGKLIDTPFFDGDTIMVGNSASYSNNHLYVLNLLKRMDLKDELKFTLVLSYGGSKQYVSEVENAYNSSFPQNVEVLTNYLPLQVYNQIFLKVRSMVMSAWRQESIGTIIMGLYLGIKVFMSERSPLYKWFVDCGFNVFAIETAKGEDLDTPLSTKDKQRNRELVLERYNEERIARSLKENIVD